MASQLIKFFIPPVGSRYVDYQDSSRMQTTTKEEPLVIVPDGFTGNCGFRSKFEPYCNGEYYINGQPVTAGSFRDLLKTNGFGTKVYTMEKKGSAQSAAAGAAGTSKGFVMVRKKSYSIWADILAPHAPSIKVYNYLEDTWYQTSAERRIILTGTASEQWLIGDKKFCDTYTDEKGMPISSGYLSVLFEKAAKEKGCDISQIMHLGCRVYKTSPSSATLYARQVPVSQTENVNTSWGDVLKANAPGVPHGVGDWVMSAVMNDAQGRPVPNPNDQWVVNGMIFPDTYEIVGSIQQDVTRTGGLRAMNFA